MKISDTIVYQFKAMQDFFVDSLIMWLTILRTLFPTLLWKVGHNIEGQVMEVTGV